MDRPGAGAACRDGDLGALDADEQEQLAGLLRKLLLSEPFRELDPATTEPDRPRRARRRTSYRPPTEDGSEPTTSG